ncbi:MAG: DUF3352 domain-containing protein [Solirubrobacteraceae bacterium]
MTGVRLTVIALLAGLVLVGCGSSTPTAASPAPLAPPHSLAYLELTVRPQGADRDAVESALTKLIGHSPDGALQGAASKLLAHAGLSYKDDVEPWLGQKIGIVVTHLSLTGVGVILPTDDPSAALHALRKLGGGHLTPASHAGVHFETATVQGDPVALGIVGQNAVIAAPSVFREIIDAYHGNSLTKTTEFASAFASLPSNSLVKGYVNAALLGSELRGLFGSTSSAMMGSLPLRQVLGAALGKLRGAFGIALSATPHSLAIDVHSTVAHRGASADVRGLPGQSWLAVASRFNPRRIIPLVSAFAQNPLFAVTLSHIREHLGIDLIHDVLPALGPFELSAQGTTALTAGAGLVVKPTDPAAAERLLAAIRRLAARSSSLVVQGTKRSFSITKAGLPIPRVVVVQTPRHVVVTLDESVSNVLSPSSHLATNPRFTAALAQVPAGSHVPLFLDFRGLSELLGGLPNFSGSSGNEKILTFVQRLDYLIVGSNPADGQARVVLGLR